MIFVLEPGIAILPACKCQRRMTCAEVLPWAVAMAEMVSSLKSVCVLPRPPRGNQLSMTVPYWARWSFIDRKSVV